MTVSNLNGSEKPYLPFFRRTLINLLVPPLRTVRVYSPFLFDAFRTKKVPSVVSINFSLTSSLKFPRHVAKTSY